MDDNEAVGAEISEDPKFQEMLATVMKMRPSFRLDEDTDRGQRGGKWHIPVAAHVNSLAQHEQQQDWGARHTYKQNLVAWQRMIKRTPPMLRTPQLEAFLTHLSSGVEQMENAQ